MKAIKRLQRAAIGACVAGVSFGAGAVDDVRGLKAEVDALKKEVQQLRALIQGNREQAATKQEGTPIQNEVRQANEMPAKVPAEGRTVHILGTPVTIYGTLNADAGIVERKGATAATTALNSMVGAPGASPTNPDQPLHTAVEFVEHRLPRKREPRGGVSAVFQVESAIGIEARRSGPRCCVTS
jgi:hypothetical protein